MSKNLPVKAHATLGASTAARWMACPGSVRLTRDVPNVESEYAREGTAAHALAEVCLRRRVDPSTYEGMELEGVHVTDDMTDFVRIFVDYCRLQKETASEFWIEHKFSLAEINPPEPMFGTADFVVYDEQARELHVIDLKYGQGVVVEAKGNKQLRYYALGAALSLGAGRQIETVKMTIVQPRAAHQDGITRSEVMPIEELVGFAGELLDSARETLNPNAVLKAGPHCRFCPISARCPEQLRQAQAVAQVEFDALPLDVPPTPEALPLEVFADMFQKLPILEDWIKAMYAHASLVLERGEEVPGLKLVAKRATRRWASEEQARQWLEGVGYAPEEMLDMSLKSVAQIEKLVGGRTRFPPSLWKRSRAATLWPSHPTPARPSR